MSIVSCIYQHCQMVIFLCKLAEEQQFIYLTVVNIYKISGQKLKTYLKIISLSLISYKRFIHDFKQVPHDGYTIAIDLTLVIMVSKNFFLMSTA